MPNGLGPLPERHARILAEKLRDGQLVLFVGAGLSYLCPRNDGKKGRLPLWKSLQDEVARLAHLDASQFRDALDIFDYVESAEDRGTLERHLQACLDDRSYDPSPAHLGLKELPWHQIVTTNYDALLARLLDEVPIAEERDFDRLSAKPRPRLIHLHGTLQRPHTLTKDDYRLWQQRHPRAFHHLKELLLTKTLLFVGFSLTDPNIDHILAVVRSITKQREKRVYAWMWRSNEMEKRLLDKRYKIEVVSIEQADDWATAFGQLEEVLGEGPLPVVVNGEPDPYAYDRSQYKQAMQKRYGVANMQHLYMPGAGYTRDDILLDEIFVEPDLVAEQADRYPDPVDVARRRSELDRFRSREEEDLKQQSEVRRPAGHYLGSRKLVILGQPGQGKSTLLRHWLLRSLELWSEDPQSQPFPVLVRLSDWESGMGKEEGRLRRYLEEILPRISEARRSAAAHWKQGAVLWFLDGLDEIRDPHERDRLREELRGMSQRNSGDRWIVASRPTGFPASGLGSDWEVMRLPALSPQQSEAILEKWAGVLGKKEGLELDYRQMAQNLERSGLRQLRGNALLLTLAVLFYKANKRLPQDRWEYYEHAEKTLRDAWVRHRIPEAERYLPGRYLPVFLDGLALEGMLQGKVTFSRRELEESALPVLQAHGYSGRGVDEELNRLLQAAEDLIGVLVAQAPDRFGFLHLSMQEFLAARTLVQRSGEVRRHIARYWDHPDWALVWSLYALGVSQDRTRLNELFQTVLENAHSLDEQLHRHWKACLTWAGVGSSPEALQTQEWPRIEKWAVEMLGVPKRIWSLLATLDALANWEKDWPAALRESVLRAVKSKVWDIRFEAAKTLSTQAGEASVRQELLELLSDEDDFILEEAAQALSAQARENALRQALLDRLSYEDSRVREGAARALSAQTGEAVVRQALLDRLDDEHERVLFVAAHALSSQAGEATVRQALLARLGDEDGNVRCAATIALSSQAGEAVVLHALLQRLGDQNAEVRNLATRSLSSRAGETVVRQALLELLDDEDGSVRHTAALTLSSQSGEVVVREALLERLGEKNGSMRYPPVKALSPQAGEPVVRQALLDRLGDEDGFVRSAAVEALFSQAGKRVVSQALLERLHDEQKGVRFAAIQALSSQAGEANVRQALLERLHDEQNDVRYAAADALSSQAGETTVRQALLGRLNDDDGSVRHAAALALSSQVGEATVRQALLRRLNDADGFVRHAAALALSSQAGEATARRALLGLLNDAYWDVRLAAAQALNDYAWRNRSGTDA